MSPAAMAFLTALALAAPATATGAGPSGAAVAAPAAPSTTESAPAPAAPPAAAPVAAPAPPAPPATPTPVRSTPTPTPTGAKTATPAGAPGALHDPAPRPVADLRVQNRYARNAASMTQLFVGVDYFERRDYYISPGVRFGGTYYLGESLGLEVQGSRFFSTLNNSARQVLNAYGVLPDSRPATWLFLGGLRYSMGFGKMMISGVNHVVHLQPQAVMQLGMHIHDGSLGPSGLAGIGLLVHITPRWFVRLDGAMTLELESRLDGSATVLGFLPSLVAGGTL
jgi:hypothetical protein